MTTIKPNPKLNDLRWSVLWNSITCLRIALRETVQAAEDIPALHRAMEVSDSLVADWWKDNHKDMVTVDPDFFSDLLEAIAHRDQWAQKKMDDWTRSDTSKLVDEIPWQLGPETIQETKEAVQKLRVLIHEDLEQVEPEKLETIPDETLGILLDRATAIRKELARLWPMVHLAEEITIELSEWQRLNNRLQWAGIMSKGNS